MVRGDKLKYDFYTSFQIETKNVEKSKEEIDQLTRGLGTYSEIRHVPSRIMLLTSVHAIKQKFPDKRNHVKIKGSSFLIKACKRRVICHAFYTRTSLMPKERYEDF